MNIFLTALRAAIFLSKLFKKHSFFLEVDEERIKKCIEISHFKNLQKLEKSVGFDEKNKTNVLFFNEGQTKQWKDKLDKKTIYRIEKKFKNEMKELNYI